MQQKITHGQPNWDDPINDNFTELYEKANTLSQSGNIHWTDWSQVEVTLMNGAKMERPFKKNQLVNGNGDVLFTQITGTVSFTGWDGRHQDFCHVSGVPQTNIGELIGGATAAAVQNDATGYAKITFYTRDNDGITLAINGKRPEGGTLDGWIGFRILY